MNERELLEELINRSLERLYKDDLDLIVREANERTIAAHFANYFELYSKELKYKSLFEGLNEGERLSVDVEYNRSGGDSKGLIEGSPYNYPDFIFHQRREQKNNILIIEFKAHWSKETQEEDIIKIQLFMSEKDEYKYRYGATVMLGIEEPTLNWISK
ncbi:MAG: hypothetical protein SNJ29_11500 [Rikenellaceae bacterium]